MRKCVSVVLIFMLILCSSNFSFCMNEELHEKPIFKLREIAEYVARSLVDISPIKSDLGFEGIDFSDLSLGSPIVAYEVTPRGTLEATRYYYPIFSNKGLVALATEIDETHYQLSRALCDIIAGINPEQIALIYDDQACYLFDGKHYKKLCGFLEKCDGRGTLYDVNLENQIVKIMTLKESVPIKYDSKEEKAVMQNYYSCSITAVPQVYSKICWAASMATILNYVQNPATPHTAYSIATSLTGSTSPLIFNQGQLDSFVHSKFWSVYGLQYKRLSAYSNQVISDSVMVTNLSNGYPIYGRFDVDNMSVDHVCTVYGIHIVSGYISIADPEGTQGSNPLPTYNYACYYSGSPYYSYRYVSYFNNEGHTLINTLSMYIN